MSQHHAGYRSAAARAYWLPLLPLPCLRCGGVVDKGMRWHVDHVVPLSESRGQDPNDANGQWPAHAGCNTSHGSALAKAKKTANNTADQRLLGM